MGACRLSSGAGTKVQSWEPYYKIMALIFLTRTCLLNNCELDKRYAEEADHKSSQSYACHEEIASFS